MQEIGGVDYVYLKDFERVCGVDARLLTSEEDRNYIQQLIVLCDLCNNGMTRMEVIRLCQIGLIQKMAGCSFKEGEQHWYYCQRKQLFPELKNHSILQTVQVTTNKRSVVTTKKLLHWYGMIDKAFHELHCLNCWHADWEGIKNSNKIDGFWGNMDETNMSAADCV